MAAAGAGALVLSLATPSFAAGRAHHASYRAANVTHHASRVYHGRRVGAAAAAAGVGLAAGTVLGAAAANAAAPGYYGAPYDYYDPYAGVYGAAPIYAPDPFGAYAAAPCACGSAAYGYGPTYFPASGYPRPPFVPGYNYSYGYGYGPGANYAYGGYRYGPYASERTVVGTYPGYVGSNGARYGYARASAAETGGFVESRSSQARYTRVSTSAERGASAGSRVPAERTAAQGAPRASAMTNAAGQCFTTTDKDRGFGYYGECKK
jgi:hypothetical protein